MLQVFDAERKTLTCTDPVSGLSRKYRRGEDDSVPGSPVGTEPAPDDGPFPPVLFVTFDGPEPTVSRAPTYPPAGRAYRFLRVDESRPE
jgi:hypothetical protein